MTKDVLLGRALRALDAVGATTEPRAFHVPGRIEVLGKHTDYAGGRSLLCAVERGIVIVAASRTDGTVRIRSADARDQSEEFVAAGVRVPRVARDDAADVHWWRYARTVVSRIRRDFPDARTGADIAFASNLPMDSGLSSSSALVVAIFLALDAVNDISSTDRYRAAIPTREALAEYLGAVENGRAYGALEAAQGVGTLGGSEDHTAILCCVANALSRYSFCPVRFEQHIPMPRDRVFLVAFSGVAAAKAGNALSRYNEASLATQELLRLWNSTGRGSAASLAQALDADRDAYQTLRRALPTLQSRDFTVQRLLDRLEQFSVESREIIPAAADALRRGALQEFGAQVDRSQANAERLLGNQVPETIALVRSARGLGADAASAFGGGFGGSVWAMTRGEDAERFMREWRARYAAEFPDAASRAIFFATGAHDGAREIPPEQR